MKKILMLLLVVMFAASPVWADVSFTNGGFEDGNLNGWTLGSQANSGATYGSAGTGLTTWSPGTNGGVAAAVVPAGTDSHVPIATSYNGSAARIGDDRAWGFSGGGNIYNWIEQSAVVTGSDAGMFYFAWAAVLQESGHAYNSTPFFEVSIVKNGTTNIYDYKRYEQDGGFWTDLGSWRYSTGNSATYPGWYVETLNLATLGVNIGDTLTLKALARDCTPSAHAMYVYVDGFGATKPPDPGTVPEPSVLLLFGAGLAGLGVIRSRFNK